MIAVDLPGFGDSEKPIGATTMLASSPAAAVDLLDALELDRVHLVGNSLGGRVALEAGLLHPDRVDRRRPARAFACVAAAAPVGAAA